MDTKVFEHILMLVVEQCCVRSGNYLLDDVEMVAVSGGTECCAQTAGGAEDGVGLCRASLRNLFLKELCNVEK